MALIASRVAETNFDMYRRHLELFRYGGNELVKHLHTIIKDIWQKETMPTEWNVRIICSKHKKGDIMEYSNYRGVRLLNTAYKILSNIVCKNLTVC